MSVFWYHVYQARLREGLLTSQVLLRYREYEMSVFWYQVYQAKLWELLWHREACQTVQHVFSKLSLVNLISKYINFTRQGFENPCWHCQACQGIEKTRWVSFDIKLNRQGFENACWHCEAYREIENTRWESFVVKFIRQGFSRTLVEIARLPERFNMCFWSWAW